MPRRCSVCAIEEHLLTIDARLRNGESAATIAAEFSVSPDAVERHRKRHVHADTIAIDMPLDERLRLLWARVDETYRHATATGDVKVAVDCLGKLTNISEQLSKFEIRAGFESMDTDRQVDYVMKHDRGRILRALCDKILDHGRERGWGKHFAQSSDSVS
jgi:hypothetical protein